MVRATTRARSTREERGESGLDREETGFASGACTADLSVEIWISPQRADPLPLSRRLRLSPLSASARGGKARGLERTEGRPTLRTRGSGRVYTRLRTITRSSGVDFWRDRLEDSIPDRGVIFHRFLVDEFQDFSGWGSWEREDLRDVSFRSDSGWPDGDSFAGRVCKRHALKISRTTGAPVATLGGPTRPRIFGLSHFSSMRSLISREAPRVTSLLTWCLAEAPI